MKFYLDITLLPDAEANLGFLWQKTYAQLHLALVEMKTADGNSDIAVSFPKYGSSSFPLGDKLRLLAVTEEMLHQLDLPRRLSRFRDYCQHTSIKSVPKVDQYACFKRKQYDTNLERLACRRAKRKGESYDEAIMHFLDFKDKLSNLPFINLESSSTTKEKDPKHRFRLFIERVLVNEPTAGEFNCYGLSNHTTVPWFD